ncbi:hypothetical protein P152DRAFT_483408 [Eremomyces bilateralis CBS 781.70]|uniref:Protein YAE1 n=1 Tax=Eremomyces bilateralis CBS 781.70 TaxID=1392243 RepID=A0A6G1FYZ7_9PEZI|nr:uncharacterized protein P152DRAFT_483408 [Eremomyces bilateralis CBS 781.70]KAF1811095.1 hypothetical protein P152DRAFT_483408 [Eremomyces bilateralis CBS 781.70]
MCANHPSPPASPLSLPVPPPFTSPPENLLDDVFESSHPTSHDPHAAHDPAIPPPRHEPDDQPRLRQTHVAAGYREGISTAKEGSMQMGFDRGYEVGGAVGREAGWVVGALGAILVAVGRAEGEGQGGVRGGLSGKVARLLEEARGELTVEELFREEVMGEFRREVEVRGLSVEVYGGRLVKGHPVLERWRGRVREVVGEAGMDVRLLDMEG